jgi:hypothetical protein
VTTTVCVGVILSGEGRFRSFILRVEVVLITWWLKGKVPVLKMGEGGVTPLPPFAGQLRDEISTVI